MKLVVSRFDNLSLVALDWTLSALVMVWLTLGSAGLSSYCLNTRERDCQFTRTARWCLLGPLALGAFLAMLPLGLPAFILQTVLKCGFSSKNFYQVSFVDPGTTKEEAKVSRKPKKTLSIVTANVLMGYDLLGKTQNMSTALQRMRRQFRAICRSGLPRFRDKANLLDHPSAGRGLEDPSQVIETRWPSDADVICLQEVWDRGSALAYLLAIRRSSPEFRHFIFDTTRTGWTFSNLCFGGGLMVASKLPILEADFYQFRDLRTTLDKVVSYGMLNLKLDVGGPPDDDVGYLANLHLPAFREPADMSSLFDEVLSAMAGFEGRTTTTTKDNRVTATCGGPRFRIICGDFNLTTPSADADSIAFPSEHDLFRKFVDLPRESWSQDKAWALPTCLYSEHMQSRAIETPICQKDALLDPKVRAVLYEGRFDRILFDPSLTLGRPKNYYFLTCFGNASDHIPVTMTFEEEQAHACDEENGQSP